MQDGEEKPELVDPNADAVAVIDDSDAGNLSLPEGESERRTGPLDLVLEEVAIARSRERKQEGSRERESGFDLLRLP